MKFMKDFSKGEKPKGSPILNSSSELVGVLGHDGSAKKRIQPIWINGTSEGDVFVSLVIMAIV